MQLVVLLGQLLAAAGLLRLPASLLFFAAGLGAAFLPGLPSVQVDQRLLTTLFLPAILYVRRRAIAHATRASRCVLPRPCSGPADGHIPDASRAAGPAA